MTRLLTGAPDPVAEFWRAHERGEPIAVRTSGTMTASARTIVRTTASWVDSFPLVAGKLAMTTSDVVWIPGPLDATMNLFAACLATHMGARWSASAQGASIAQLTPTGLAALAADPSPVQPGATVLVAGDGLSHALRDRAQAAGLRVQHYYGATELSLVAWGGCADDLRLVDGVQAELRDADDSTGTLWVRSPWLSNGPAVGTPVGAWRRDPRGFATVGDQARLDGVRLQVLGRPGSVTTAGQTVALSPLAALLSQHTAEPVRLLGLPHATLGQVVTAVVSSRADLDAARGWARCHLTAGERPRRWVIVDPLPVTAAGKVDLRRLAALASTTTPAAQSNATRRTSPDAASSPAARPEVSSAVTAP